MAQADGSIRIDTQINTENASAQLMSLQNRIVKTADKIASLRSKMDALRDAKIPTQDYKEVSAQIEKAEQKFYKLLEKQEQMQREGKDNGVAWQRLNDQMDEVGDEIRYAQGELQDLVDTGKAFTLGSETAEYEKLGQQLRHLEGDFAVLIQRQNELSQRQGISPDGYERLRAYVSDTVGEMSELIRTSESARDSLSPQNIDLSGYDRLRAAIEELKSSMGRLRGFSLVSTTNDALNSIAERIREVPVLAEDAARRFSSAFKNYVDTAIDSAKEKLAGFAASVINVVAHPLQALKGVAGAVVGGVASAIKSGLVSAFEAIKAKTTGVAESIINGIAHPFHTVKTVAGASLNGVKKLLSGMASVAKKAGGVIGSLASRIKNAATSMLSFGRNTKSTNGALQGGLMSILKYGLGIRSLYALISKFRSGIKEGFGNLAQYSAPVNANISSLISALETLKNALATAFAPILNVVAPILTTFINMVSKAVTYVGMLIAALTGQSTFTKAVGVQKDYAASLGSSAGAAKKAAKATKEAAKEAEGYLSPLDEINKLEKDKDTGAGAGDGGAGGGGGGGGSGGIGDMFETVDIPSQIGNLADMIKKAWENADFTEIGGLIGSKLKDALESIPWEDIQNTAAKVGKSLATLINGFIEVEGLGRTIGNTIAQAINTGLIGLEAFAKNLHWDSVGKFIAGGINGVLENIDWDTALSAAKLFGAGIATALNNALSFRVFENVGRTIGMLVNSALTFAESFLDKFDFKHFGKGIAKGLNKAIKAIDWEQIGRVIGKSLNGLFDTIGAFAEEFDWSGFAKSLGTSISTAVATFRWDDAGTNIAKFVNGCFDALKTFFDETDWEELGKGITTAISSFFSEFDWGKVSGTLSSFLIGLLDFLIGLIEGIDWSEVPQGIINEISDFLNGFDYAGVFGKIGELIGTAVAAGIDLLKALKDVLSRAWDRVVDYFSGYIEDSGGDIVDGLFRGILDAIKNIGKWVKDNIVDPFVNGFKNALGIHSPSTVMAELGGDVMQGLIDGINGLIDSVVQIFTDIKNSILETWDTIKQNTAEVWDSVKTKISDTWESVKTKVSTTVENAKTKISTAWDNIKTKTANTWESVKTKISTAWTNVKTSVSTAIGIVKTKITTAWDNIKTKTTGVWNSVKTKVTNVWTTFKTKVASIFPGIKDTIVNAWNDIKSRTSSIWNGIRDAVKSPINAIIGFLNTLISGISSAINGLTGMLNNLNIDIPDWVPGVGGKSLGFNIPEVKVPKIPALATGAVIPPNREFLAVLGDQNRGTNIEAPLDTIVEAMMTALSRQNRNSGNSGSAGNINLTVEVNRGKLFDIFIEESKLRQMRSGRIPGELR